MLKSNEKLIGIFIKILLFTFLLFSHFGFEHNNILSCGSFYLSYGLNLVFLILLLINRDPGYENTKKPGEPTNVISEILDNIKNDQWRSTERDCFSCLIPQKDSTQHCLICNRCVFGFQFHLKRNNFGLCIGYRNFPLYYCYILFTLLTFYAYSFGALQTGLNGGTTAFPIVIIEKWIELAKTKFFVSAVVILILLASIEILYNLFVMSVAICSGLTVHEMRHMNLYKYLFDLKEIKDQGMKYVHKKRTFMDIIGNVGKFGIHLINSIKGIKPNVETQYIQLKQNDISVS